MGAEQESVNKPADKPAAKPTPAHDTTDNINHTGQPAPEKTALALQANPKEQRDTAGVEAVRVKESGAAHLGTVEVKGANDQIVTLDAKGKAVQVDDHGKNWTSEDGKTFTCGAEKKMLVKDKDGVFSLVDAAKTQTPGSRSAPETVRPNAVAPRTDRAPASAPGSAPRTDSAPANAPGSAPRTDSAPANAPGSAPRTDSAPANAPGSAPRTDSAPANAPGSAPGAEKPLDDAALLKDAIAIHKAADADFNVFRWADKDGINKILEGKTDAERARIGDLYQTKYVTKLDDEIKKFEKGSDLDFFENIYHRKDSSPESQNAQRIHEDLLENKNWVSGRSHTEIEKDIRLTLSTHSPEQLAKMDQEYKSQYGVSLQDAIASDKGLSQTTKDMAHVYMTGKHDDADTTKLIDIALKADNSTLRHDAFQEAMRDASKKARTDFSNNDGAKRLQEAFGQGVVGQALDVVMGPIGDVIANNHAKALAEASDAAKEGKIDASTQIAENTGLFTNTKGIELAIKEMSDAERQQYFNGKAMESGKTVDGLSASDQATAKAYYDKVHGALSNAANSTELAKYEDQIATNGQGSFVGSLARHRGMIYNDSAADIGKDISSMSQQDWQDCKQHPERRDALQQMLASLNKSPLEIKDLLKQYDAKLGADTFDKASPPQDISSKLDSLPRNFVDDGQGGQMVADTGDTIRAVQKAFKDDPKLQDRILHPQSDDDKKLAASFQKSLQNALGDDYETFGKPLVESGHVPLEIQMNLNKGVFSTDAQKAFQDIANATPEERARLKTDQKFQEEVLGSLNKTDRQIALNVAEQGSVNPEDKIHSIENSWGGSAEILDTLKSIKPEDLARVRAANVSKYGGSFDGDLMNKLTGSDRDQAERILTQNLSAETRVNIAKTVTENTDSGFGAWATDKVFQSATVSQANDALNRTNHTLQQQNELQQAIINGNEVTKKMTPDQQVALQQQLSKQLNSDLTRQGEGSDNVVEAKKKGGEYVGDAAIATVAIGSMILTGGADAPLVATLAFAGAGIKIGTNAIMEGNNYDWSVKNVSTDGAIGTITAVTSVIGPGQVAAIFNIGESAAKESASLTIGALAEAGMSTTVREGGQELLETGTKSIIRDALSSGATKLDESAFKALAEKAVADNVTGEARERAVSLLAEQLRQNVAERMSTGIVRYAAAEALNAGGGALGGGAGGFVQGAVQWDGSKTVSENLAMIAKNTEQGAFTGALAGGITTAAIKGGQNVLQSIKGGIKGEVPVVPVNPAAGGSELSAAENAAARRTVEGTTVAVGGTAVVDGSAENALKKVVTPAGEGPRIDAKPALEPKPVIAKETPNTKEPIVEAKTKPEPVTEKPVVELNRANDPAAKLEEKPGVERVNAQGERINTQGERINEQGERINAKNQVLDKEGHPVNEKGEIIDSKDNPIAREFPDHSPEQKALGRQTVESELADWKTIDGKNTKQEFDSLADKLGMTPAEKDQILDGLAAVRDHGARLQDIDPEQVVNWNHTEREFGAAVQYAERNGFTKEQTQDMLLAAMWSDGSKTKFNFTTHNLDGALAFEQFAKNNLKDFSPERIAQIQQAIREHQVAPPEFMSMIYGGAIMNGKPPLTEAQVKTLGELQAKMSNPFKPGTELIDVPGGPPGAKALKLSAEEQALLQRSGQDNWFVPSAENSWNKISRGLIDADGIDNYAGPGGMSKIIKLRGPDKAPVFRDRSARFVNPEDASQISSQESWMRSQRDFLGDPEKGKFGTATNETRAYTKEIGKDLDQHVQAAQQRVDDWINSVEGRKALNLPSPTEQAEVKIPGWTGTPEHPDLLNLGHEGNTPEELARARQIWDRYGDELGKEQRVDLKPMQPYEPVMKPEDPKNLAKDTSSERSNEGTTERDYTRRPVGGKDDYDSRIPSAEDAKGTKISYDYENHNGNWRASKIVDGTTTIERVPGKDNELIITEAGGNPRHVKGDIDVLNNGNYVIKNETLDAASSFNKDYTGPGGEKWQPEPGSTMERNRFRGDIWTSPTGQQTWVDNKGVIWHNTGGENWESAQGKFSENRLGGGRWDWKDGRSEMITPEGMGAVHDPKTMATGEWRTEDGGLFKETPAASDASAASAIDRKALAPANHSGEPSSKYPPEFFTPPSDATYEGKESGFDVWRAKDGTVYNTGGDGIGVASRSNPDGSKVWMDNHGRVWEPTPDNPYKFQNEFGTYESSATSKGQRWTWNDGSADWIDNDAKAWHHSADMPKGQWQAKDGSFYQDGSGKFEFRWVGSTMPFVIPTGGVAGAIGTQAGRQAVDSNDKTSTGDARSRIEALAVSSAERVPQTRELTKTEVQALWDQGAKTDGVFKFQKGYYEANLTQVNPAENPNGIIFSSSEKAVKLSSDLQLPGGQVIKAGTELPNGVQLSPGKIEVQPDGSKVLTDVKLTTPPDGVRLPDGGTLKSTEIGSMKVEGGAEAKPNEYIIQRASTDDAGNPRIDTYAQDPETKGRKWDPVDGHPGVYSPKLGSAGLVEMVKIPDDMRVKFMASYGEDVSNKGPAYLVKSGEGHYIITERDLRETYVGADGAGRARMKNILKDASSEAGFEVPRAAIPVPKTQELDQVAVNKLWDQQANSDGVLKFQKGYYEAHLAQVNRAENPNGIIFSSSEKAVKLSSDLQLPGGQLIKAGTELPNGVQLSPGKIEVQPDGSKVLTDVKLTTPPDGVRLPDGSTLKSTELGSMKVEGGAEAKPDDYIIQRASTDDAGNPRIDTYKQDPETKGRKWDPVDGHPGVYSPKLGSAGPVEMVKIPDNMRVKFMASYGEDVSNKGPAYLVKSGEGHYIITERDLRETYIGADGPSATRMKAMLDDASAESGIRVPSAKTPEGVTPYRIDVDTPKETYIKTATVKAEMVTEDNFKWINHDAPAGQQEQVANKGDYMIFPADGGPFYVAEGKLFRQSYHDMPGFKGQYAKNVAAEAQRLDGPATVNNTTQGITKGDKDDYLVTDNKGNQYIVPKGTFEGQYAPQAGGSSRTIEPMNLPKETGPETPLGAGVTRSTWEKGDIVRNANDNTVIVNNDETGEYKMYKDGRLYQERTNIESSGEGTKTIVKRYPYEDMDSVNKLPTPSEYNEALLKTEYQGKTLSQVKDEAMSMPDSLKDPTIDQTKRAALQKEIEQDRWNKLLKGDDETAQKLEFGQPKQEKRARILMGLTGSGKTSAGMADLKDQGFMVLESDELKPYFPEYKGGVGATALRNESNNVNDKLLQRAIDGGYNFVLPGVGTNAKWMEEMIGSLHDAGWKVDLVFVDIPPAESMTRVVSRFKSEGRFVDPGFLVSHGHVPEQNFRQVVDDMFVNGNGLNSFKHIWNYGKKPITLEAGGIE